MPNRRNSHETAPDGISVPNAVRHEVLLRRAGTSYHEQTMDPGSAAHRAANFSALKTRVNALMALRSIQGTAYAFERCFFICTTRETMLPELET
jgi:hypothetical protein